MNATMNAGITRINEDHYFPCVTAILSTETGVLPDAHVAVLAKRVEKELLTKYKSERVRPVIDKLQHALLKSRNGHSKSRVVIFVSPIIETVLHLDLPLEETLLIDEAFEIRDLVNSMQPANKYLALVQSASSFKLFLGNGNSLLKLRPIVPDNIAAYVNDVPEKVENFTNVADGKEILMDKFIHHIDDELDHYLNKFKLPVFVLGTERMNGHFKKYTHHGKAIVSYLSGNYEEATIPQLLDLLTPLLEKMKDIERKELKERMEAAMNADKLSIGIDEVWRNAMEKKGRLLLVEEGYSYPHIEDQNGIMIGNTDNVEPELVKDAVDVIIERVLESGGEVKFVDADLVADFARIALIQYF